MSWLRKTPPATKDPLTVYQRPYPREYKPKPRPPSADLLAALYQIQFHSADLLRAILTRDTNWIEKDIARIRLSLNALESKWSVEMRDTP